MADYVLKTLITVSFNWFHSISSDLELEGMKRLKGKSLEWQRGMWVKLKVLRFLDGNKREIVKPRSKFLQISFILSTFFPDFSPFFYIFLKLAWKTSPPHQNSSNSLRTNKNLSC
jgi:hypothetical protein